MSSIETIYYLDANVLIQAWQKYYSPKICPDYWKLLDQLGAKGIIAIPEMVYEEISRTEDDLSNWLKKSAISKVKINEQVTKCLKDIYAKDPIHLNLVDNTKARSLADPWLIAHAIESNAVIVTKEEKITAPSSKKIKIPNVCDTMGVRWINDFQFVQELNFQFSCALK